MSPLPAVLTVEETAAVLRIGRSSAYDGVRRGDIPSIRVGRKIRVPRHALEAMLGSREISPHNDFEPAANGPEAKESDDGAHPSD